ncbi:uncharacterized protein LOC125672852 [Ostrea edulis]|uniref:uncharacterized protein LOC125672852 n=1 Tax=Ostrea edulis TaxID=37623 RepID=UPI0024AF2738|nr:uncharacterized protein LOC125672852 [Ostrea edulis]
MGIEPLVESSRILCFVFDELRVITASVQASTRVRLADKEQICLESEDKGVVHVHSSFMWMSDASIPIMGQYKCRSSYGSKFSKTECDARDGSLHLKTKYEYWHQIQGQQHLKDTQCCDC